MRAFHPEANSFGLAMPLLRLGTFGQGYWEHEIDPIGFVFADGFEAASMRRMVRARSLSRRGKNPGRSAAGPPEKV